ncbi:FAD:protein FMN transferase [uncultured Treponema sp.]|uniref:FAD:protein FMN transferase n=1 Tax=uncultured Treponema sp. TaxID=162155 RepID=UPI00260114DC|nr:FAD:protein FMN transferase [uncultured Treponema sp.]
MRTLGTVCFVNLFEKGTKSAYKDVFDRLEQINDEFSFAKEKSDLYRVNNFAFNKEVVVCDDVFTVISMALKISEMTEGAFDITVEPLVSLWRVNTPTPHVATQAELDERLPLVDYKNVVLNPEKKSVRFLKKGMQLDLGGIAKGFAADEIVKICKTHNIRRAVIDLGGNVYVYGSKEKSQLWNVGIKNPEYPDSVPLLKLAVPEISVVTSGMYERYFESGEKRYHHILSPKTGYPIENELYSVSVLSTNSMLADSLTTAFFVLGTEKALEVLPQVKKEFGLDLSAIFIKKNHQIVYSENFPYPCDVIYEDW